MDFDNGAHRAIQKHRVPGFQLDDYGKLKAQIQEGLLKRMHEEGYRTCCLDTGGTLLDNYMAKWLIEYDAKNGNNTGGLSMSGWGALSVEFSWLCNQIRNAGMHTILVCHAKDDDGDVVLDMKGSSKQAIHASADLIGYIYKQGKSFKLDFNPQQTSKGSRIGKNTGNHPVYTVPDPYSEKFDGLMTRIFTATYSKMQEMTSAQKEALELTNNLKGQINAAETFKQLEEIRDQIKPLSHTYRAGLDKLLAEAYVKLYAAMHFDGLKTDKDFTTAAVELKQNIEGRSLQTAVWRNLSQLATDAGFIFDKDNVKFVASEKVG